MTEWNLPPGEIEKRSFAIIEAEAPEHSWPPEVWSVIRRMIHTTADFEYVTSVRLQSGGLAPGIEAIRQGRTIVTDTNMARMGMTTRRLEPFGVRVECLVDHPEVARTALAEGRTRSAAAVDLSVTLYPGAIYAIGNAPTALFRLMEHIRTGQVSPAFVVGLPVGFVNAAESKAELLKLDIPYLTNVGRKGGSNVAASVINALAELA
jgi:precorrin-8X/cobalt-precorrin-8 methylmutase